MAIESAKLSLQTSDKPIFLLDELVHNNFVNEEFKKIGIQILNPIPNRLIALSNFKNGTIIFGAHGSSKEEYQIAKKNNLKIIDATCKFVLSTMKKIEDKINNYYEVIYIGYKNHKEALACKSINSTKIIIVECESDIDNLNIISTKIYATCQTTLSKIFVDKMFNKIKEKYPQTIFEELRCLATTNHQNAIINMDKDIDGIIVISDSKSNNGKELYYLAQKKLGADNAIMISSLKELNCEFLASHHYIGITSAASTPNSITNLIYNFVLNFDKDIKDSYDKVIPEKLEII